MMDIGETIAEFRAWLKTPEASDQLRAIEREKQEVKDLMRTLSEMDKESEKFTDLVLYGLLPYANARNAKRTSAFPVFMNIKQFLKGYNYSDKDWNVIANMIFKLAEKFDAEPEKLDRWISEFTADKLHARMLQSGSLSPILFCLNDSFPVVNAKVIRTYKKLGRVYGWDDRMTRNLDSYLDSKQKCEKLIRCLDTDEIRELPVFAQFCWWFDKRDDDVESEEDEEDTSQTVDTDIDLESVLNSIDLEKTTRPDLHILRSPDKITIRDLLREVDKCRWQLPNFQRYFDWKKTDIRDLLDSIIKDFYIGSFLLWESDKDGSLYTIPILGAKNSEENEPDKIILDGQQRITSLYYATTRPLRTKNIQRSDS